MTYRSTKYLEWIRRQPCLRCGRVPSQAAHQGLGYRAMGKKQPDSYTVPLCFECHQLEHAAGQKTFWESYANIDVKMEIIKLLTRFLEERENV